MKWLLVIVLSNTNTPIATNLVFNSLGDCLAAEYRYREQGLEMVNKDIAAFRQSEQAKSMSEDAKKLATTFLSNRVGYGACIPHDNDKRR